MMGAKFTEPALAPYAQYLGISLTHLSLIMSSREVAVLVSNLWMPRLADSRGRVLTVLISTAGSAVAYLVQALAQYSPAAGLSYLLAGKVLAGLFGGTMPMIAAYIVELSVPDMELMKRRQSLLIAQFMVAPMMLSPIGGATASFGLNIPFFVATATAVLGLIFASRFMREVKDVKAANDWSYAPAAAKKDDDAGGGTDTATAPAAAGDVETPNPAAAASTVSSSSSTEMVALGDAAKKPAPAATPAPAPAAPDEPSLGKPFQDPVLLALGAGYCMMMVVLVSFVLLIKLLIERESFGLAVDGDAASVATQEVVAKALGVIMIPFSLTMLLSITVGYIVCSRKFGDLCCTAAGSVLTALGFVAHARATKLWHVASLGSVMGVGMGLMIGTVMNAPNLYITKVYPRQIATAKSVYQQGATLGNIVGTPVMVYLYEKDLSWIAGAGFFVGAGALLSVCAHLVQRHGDGDGEPAPKKGAPRRSSLSASQRKELLRSNAQPVDRFLASLTDELAATLEARNYHLWNGHVQEIVRVAVLERALPAMRAWDDAEKGKAHLEDVGALLFALHMDNEFEGFRARHPDLALPQRSGGGAGDGGVLSAYHELHLGGFAATDEALERARSDSAASSSSSAASAAAASRARAVSRTASQTLI